MKIDAKELTTTVSQHLGSTFWVCDFRIPDLDKKAIRNVKPTKVMLVPVKEGERVYYSENYFTPVKGKSTPIKIFDNTGYRSITGTPLNVFTDEAECREFFKNQCLAVEAALQKRIDTVVEALKQQQADIAKIRIENS